MVLRLRTLAEQRRKRDRGKDADGENDDHELDQGEALSALAEFVKHLVWSAGFEFCPWYRRLPARP
jgi:hypothetical protein